MSGYARTNGHALPRRIWDRQTDRPDTLLPDDRRQCPACGTWVRYWIDRHASERLRAGGTPGRVLVASCLCGWQHIVPQALEQEVAS